MAASQLLAKLQQDMKQVDAKQKQMVQARAAAVATNQMLEQQRAALVGLLSKLAQDHGVVGSNNKELHDYVKRAQAAVLRVREKVLSANALHEQHKLSFAGLQAQSSSIVEAAEARVSHIPALLEAAIRAADSTLQRALSLASETRAEVGAAASLAARRDKDVQQLQEQERVLDARNGTAASEADALEQAIDQLARELEAAKSTAKAELGTTAAHASAVLQATARSSASLAEHREREKVLDELQTQLVQEEQQLEAACLQQRTQLGQDRALLAAASATREERAAALDASRAAQQAQVAQARTALQQEQLLVSQRREAEYAAARETATLEAEIDTMKSVVQEMEVLVPTLGSRRTALHLQEEELRKLQQLAEHKIALLYAATRLQAAASKTMTGHGAALTAAAAKLRELSAAAQSALAACAELQRASKEAGEAQALDGQLAAALEPLQQAVQPLATGPAPDLTTPLSLVGWAALVPSLTSTLSQLVSHAAAAALGAGIEVSARLDAAASQEAAAADKLQKTRLEVEQFQAHAGVLQLETEALLRLEADTRAAEVTAAPSAQFMEVEEAFESKVQSASASHARRLEQLRATAEGSRCSTQEIREQAQEEQCALHAINLQRMQQLQAQMEQQQQLMLQQQEEAAAALAAAAASRGGEDRKRRSGEMTGQRGRSLSAGSSPSSSGGSPTYVAPYRGSSGQGGPPAAPRRRQNVAAPGTGAPPSRPGAARATSHDSSGSGGFGGNEEEAQQLHSAMTREGKRVRFTSQQAKLEGPFSHPEPAAGAAAGSVRKLPVTTAPGGDFDSVSFTNEGSTNQQAAAFQLSPEPSSFSPQGHQMAQGAARKQAAPSPFAPHQGGAAAAAASSSARAPANVWEFVSPQQAPAQGRPGIQRGGGIGQPLNPHKSQAPSGLAGIPRMGGGASPFQPFGVEAQGRSRAPGGPTPAPGPAGRLKPNAAGRNGFAASQLQEDNMSVISASYDGLFS